MKSYPRRRSKVVKADTMKDIGRCEVCCGVSKVSNVIIRKWINVTFKSKLCVKCFMLLSYDDVGSYYGVSIPEHIPIEQSIRYLKSMIAKKKESLLSQGKSNE